MTRINPYLTFNGSCEEAFHFYKSVFGGDFAYVGRFKDMPPKPDFKIIEADKERIMHISLLVERGDYKNAKIKREMSCVW